MANEITVTSTIRLVNGELSVTTPSTSKQFDQTTARGGTFTVDAGTSETSVDFGDIVPGMILLRNLDATNFLRIHHGNHKLRFEVAGQRWNRVD